MGWASGSGLMVEVIKAIDPLISEQNPKAVRAMAIKIIEAFEDEDWDTQGEALGVCDWFDQAFFQHSPYDGGYHAAMSGQMKNENPWKEKDKARKWDEGWKDWTQEQED